MAAIMISVVSINCENLSCNKRGVHIWVKVRLLFVRGNAGDTQTTAGKHDWAVFLTTDTNLSSAEILELYSLRWAIEVYFKAAKQHTWVS
jgi:IS4 transposase